jgi:hypothetical protein
MKRGFFVGFAGVLAAVHATDARADEAASLAPPPLVVSLTAGTGGGPWRLHIENIGDVPVRIAADARLLVLDVTPPAGFVDPTLKTKRAASAKAAEPRPARCVLPDDARPATDEGHDLVVPSKRSWSTSIDPLLYCFGARERAMLVSGATVTAHFGWPAPPSKAPAAATAAAQARARTKAAVLASPFVTAPVGAAVGKVAPAKELVGAPITLAETVSGAVASSASATAGTRGGDPSLPPLPPGSATLVVSMPDSLDVARGNEISTTVTVANEGDKPAVLLVRPELLRFSVAGPAGSVACGTTRAVDAPIRELFSTIGARARASVGILVSAVCPADTFDEPGIYRVVAMLDTSAASGRSVGLKTWDGEVTARSPMLLRVRTPRRAPTTTTRPALD